MLLHAEITDRILNAAVSVHKTLGAGFLLGEFSPDMDVEGIVIVESKCCKSLNAEHEAQLLNYLKPTGRRVGLLLNFGRRTLEIKRMVL